MRLPFLKLDDETTEFVVTDWSEKEHRFPGTVDGAIALWRFRHGNLEEVMSSSDLNHPNEFPQFEKHAIDIAAGYLEGAIKAGVISVGGKAPEE